MMSLLTALFGRGLFPLQLPKWKVLHLEGAAAADPDAGFNRAHGDVENFLQVKSYGTTKENWFCIQKMKAACNSSVYCCSISFFD